MLTIGTAGHIDHGKSSLVKALTQIDPDRLPEEKLRGMTLDLGFAWFSLSSGEKVGIIDVPGHEHFVRNVIPGMSGIDAAILVVAADDGWMPQTEEHMQIINLLGISHCIIALNKVDLIGDPEWLGMVEEEIAEKIDATSLKGSPIVRVSTREKTGIDELKAAIEEMSQKVVLSRDIGRPRLPVDRVFTVKGSGVVVTGTLSAGWLSSGEEVVILPGRSKANIRSVECYKESSSRAGPGCRVALNLSGVKKESLSRGDVIVSNRGDQTVSRTLDIKARLLPRPEFRLRNGEEVLVYMGTGEYISRVTLMESREMRGGETGLVQLKLAEEAPVYIGQPVVVRRQSPADTIGGGFVLDPFAPKYKTRYGPETKAWLKQRFALEPEKLILTELERHRFLERKGALSYSCYSDETIQESINKLVDSGALKTREGFIFTRRDWDAQKGIFKNTLALEHQKNPLKRGIAQSALQVTLELPREVFTPLLDELIDEGEIVRIGDWLALPGHKPELSGNQQLAANEMLDIFRRNPSAPPTFKELGARFPGYEEVIYYLIDEGELILLADGVLMETKTYQQFKEGIVEFLKKHGRLAVRDVNSLYGLSRKYSLPLLNQMDKEKITRWDGDTRQLV